MKTIYDRIIFSTGDSSNSLKNPDGNFAYIKNTDIQMSCIYAYISSGLRIVVLNEEKIGFRCSTQANFNLKESSSGTDVFSVKINGEIIWVSVREFKDYNLTEYEIPINEFKGIK